METTKTSSSIKIEPFIITTATIILTIKCITTAAIVKNLVDLGYNAYKINNFEAENFESFSINYTQYITTVNEAAKYIATRDMQGVILADIGFNIITLGKAKGVTLAKKGIKQVVIWAVSSLGQNGIFAGVESAGSNWCENHIKNGLKEQLKVSYPEEKITDNTKIWLRISNTNYQLSKNCIISNDMNPKNWTLFGGVFYGETKKV